MILTRTPSVLSLPSGSRPESKQLRLGREFFDRLETSVAASRLSVRVALGCVACLGTLRGLLSGRWPSAGEVAALHGTSRFTSRRIALAIAANEARNRLVIRRTVGRSLEPFAKLVRWRDEVAAKALRPPLILVTIHVGAVYLLSAGLHVLAERRTILRWSPVHLSTFDEESALTSGGVMDRASALRRALRGLKAGGVVLAVLDGGQGSTERAMLFGRPVDLGMGGFALPRWSGAPAFPVAALWEGNRVVLELGPAVDSPAAAARWFEALLRSSPGQTGLGLLRRLLYGAG